MEMDLKDRQISLERTFNVSAELMWEAWKNPEHLSQWWGPNGFTTTIHKMDLKEGGEWLLTMHGPDGTNYPNRSVFTEVIPMKRIAYQHFNPDFLSEVDFQSDGETTTLLWTMTFKTADLLQAVLKAHNAAEGLKQNGERLQNYLNDKLIQS
ncbi:MAG: polyketide cyclase [Rickettsiales bacterium]|nr:polyketide cyclase [Rickettsiales bacterium]